LLLTSADVVKRPKNIELNISQITKIEVQNGNFMGYLTHQHNQEPLAMDGNSIDTSDLGEYN
jgi:hypothetical protein